MGSPVRLLRPPLSTGELTRIVGYVLRPPALVLDGTECPVVVLWRGRACGLVLRRRGMLASWQRAQIPALRAAGMVVEVVDTIEDALAALAAFGCALRPLQLDSGHELR